KCDRHATLSREQASRASTFGGCRCDRAIEPPERQVVMRRVFQGGRMTRLRHRRHSPSHHLPPHNLTWLSRNALTITLTDDAAMAAAAITGDSVRPSSGYSTPAATGMPAAL